MNTKTQIVIMVCLFIQFSAQGQNNFKDFGSISKAEIELKEYDRDKDAEALVLWDVAKSYFVQIDGSFEIVFERTTRIKVFSESGIRWSEVEIPFYQEGGIFEIVYDIEACSYNFENGVISKTPFDVNNAFDERVNNHWNIKKFVVPNVKEGTIIEYRYKIKSQYMFNLWDWRFQWRIPVAYSEYEVKMVPFYEYSWSLQGANNFDSKISYVDKGLSKFLGPYSYQDMVHKYIMKDVPAFNSEEFISSINDYIIKLDFQLAKIIYPDGATVKVMSTWEEMNNEFLKHRDFGKYIQKSEKVAKKLLDSESLNGKSEREKFDIIIEYVKNNFNWNKIYSKYASKTPDKFVEDKFGNCADINLFTIGLLNASGIDSKPILISTRNNGKIKSNYPYMHSFNYVIIMANVDGNNILTDATEVLGLNDRIPLRCINDKGLIIQKDKVDWIDLECLFPSQLTTDIEIEISDNSAINASITKHATEYDALYFRTNYTDDLKKVKNNLDATGFLIVDTTIVVQNQMNKELPYILSYNHISKPEFVNDKIYLSPFLNETISDNPLKQKDRTYPIDMIYPKQRIFNSKILIPEGYTVEYLPSDKNMDNNLFELLYSARSEDNQILISLNYFFKQSVYSATDYSLIKYYFNEIVKKGNDKIVLTRITNGSN